MAAIKSLHLDYSGVFDGPVQVKSTNGKLIFSSQRTLNGKNFNETNGIPGNQLTTEYWFPWYDYKVMQTWISVGSP